MPDPAGGRRLRGIAVALVAVCGATTCGRAPEAAPSAPRRIVSIGGAVTETVFALGLGAAVVGVDRSSVWPAAATARPSVGYQRTLSAEGLLALAPDLVVASGEAGPEGAIAQVRAAGVAVAVVARVPAPGRGRSATSAETSGGASARTSGETLGATIDAAAGRIAAVGEAIGAAAQAQALAASVRARATTASAAARALWGGAAPRVAVLYARSAGAVIVSGEDTPAAAMLALVGARNAAAGVIGDRPLSAEVLVAAAPDVIVVPARSLATMGGERALIAMPGVAETPAGRERRIIAMDDLALLGFGPRLGESIEELARRIRAAWPASGAGS